MAEDIFSRIAIIGDSATRQERVIIDFLNKTAVSQLIYLSITEFAEQATVAEATVLRFCRKLGLKGYSEFRMLLAQSAHNDTAVHDANDACRILDNMISALKSTYELLNEKEIDAAAQYLLTAKRVFAFGSGNSGVAAQELRNKLMRLGVTVFWVEDSHFQLISAATLGSDDVIVLFSVSGSTKDMIAVAKTAKRNGTRLVIFTNYLKSPLASYADALLYVVSKSAPLNSGSLVTKASQLYVIDVLATRIRTQLGDTAKDYLEKTADAVLEKEY